MIDAEIAGPPAVLAVGVVRGRVADVRPLLDRLTHFAPKVVGVGVSVDELGGLQEHFAGRATEPIVPLTSHETAEAAALAEFGEVRIPHPAYIALLEWGAAQNVSITALEPTDEEYATLFTRHIHYVELVRRTLRERRLARTPPTATSADEFAVAWDRQLGPGRGSRDLASAREDAVATNARKLASAQGRVAIVVDRERFDGVVARLRA